MAFLFESMTPPRKMHAAITSRVKIMANLDIAERRLPQDGRIRATVMNHKLDLRVSTVPTPFGEKTVMRILDDRAIQVSLNQLGFGEETYESWKTQIAQPHGIILVTGPTGSGKTTTLYSSIRKMDMKRLNISTVEDPVEYNLPGITQIQTHSMIDMTFARALKALLRQDPDVVMVGEIRDQETATTAIQAALTGHLVLKHVAHKRRSEFGDTPHQHGCRTIPDWCGTQCRTCAATCPTRMYKVHITSGGSRGNV